MALFISFEGPDGSGKSTQARLLAEAMRARGHAVLETREPGGTPLGEALRYIALDPNAPDSTPLAAALVISASRAELVNKVIAPALASTTSVIVDRFSDSTIAYQSFGHGVDIETIRALNRIATGGLRPNPVIYIDVPPEVGLKRVAARGAPNRLDAESRSFHERVRRGYLQLAREEPDRWVTIDGTMAEEDVHRAVVQAVERKLQRVAGPA